jgi:hypothetical protein
MWPQTNSEAIFHLREIGDWWQQQSVGFKLGFFIGTVLAGFWLCWVIYRWVEALSRWGRD